MSHDQRGRHGSMGRCPLCGHDIDTSQRTTWRLVDGTPARLHHYCVLQGNVGYSAPGATRAHNEEDK